MESSDAGQVLKPIIVGQAYRTLGEEPLSGRSGERLAELCGLPLPDFLSRFDRITLPPNWQGRAAICGAHLAAPRTRDRAGLLHAAFTGRKIVVLGVINATAFGITWPKFSFRPFCGGELAWSPRPSNVGMFWNDPIGVEVARQFWTELARESDPARSPQPPSS